LNGVDKLLYLSKAILVEPVFPILWLPEVVPALVYPGKFRCKVDILLINLLFEDAISHKPLINQLRVQHSKSSHLNQVLTSRILFIIEVIKSGLHVYRKLAAQKILAIIDIR
jgi:hypothetical protein